MNRNRLVCLSVLLLGGVTLISPHGWAQSIDNHAQPVLQRADYVPPSSGSAAVSAAPPAAPSKLSFLSQHLRFLTVDSLTQYRYVDDDPKEVKTRDELYKLSTRVQVNLVGDGTTYLQARGESGRSFAASYDYTGIGLYDRYWSFNLKSLYLGQRIGNRFEAQAGSLEFDRGAGTEATYADNDGWMEGYRLLYASPGHEGLLDKASVTVGYVGDFTQPNAFARLYRMGDENYVQVLGQRKLGAPRELSLEFDSLQAIRYAREALRWQQLPVLLRPDLCVETITRASDNARFGWSSNLQRNWDRKGRWRGGVFYSDMPSSMFLKGSDQVLLNGDSYVLGKRMGPTLRFAPWRDLEVSLFGSDRLDNTPGPRYRGQVTLRYQLASLLNRALR